MVSTTLGEGVVTLVEGVVERLVEASTGSTSTSA